MLAATLPFVLVSNHLGLPLSYRVPTHQTNPTSSGYPAGERQRDDRRCGLSDDEQPERKPGRSLGARQFGAEQRPAVPPASSPALPMAVASARTRRVPRRT